MRPFVPTARTPSAMGHKKDHMLQAGVQTGLLRSLHLLRDLYSDTLTAQIFDKTLRFSCDLSNAFSEEPTTNGILVSA